MLHIKLKGISKGSSMVAIILPADPSLVLLLGSKGQNSTFSEHGHVSYQIKGNHQMQLHGSKYFARRTFPNCAVRFKRSKFIFFSEHCHAAYPIYGNPQRQQHGSYYFACRPLPGPAVGVKMSKFHFFRTWS